MAITNLLAASADCKSTNKHKYTSLHRAAKNGHEAAVRLLLDRGAQINARNDSNGVSALYLAAENGHDATVQLLLGHNRGHDQPQRYMSATSGRGELAQGFGPAIPQPQRNDPTVRVRDGPGHWNPYRPAAEIENADNCRPARHPVAQSCHQATVPLFGRNRGRGLRQLYMSATSGRRELAQDVRPTIPQSQRNDPTVQVRDGPGHWNRYRRAAEIENTDNNCRSALPSAAQSGHQATVPLFGRNRGRGLLQQYMSAISGRQEPEQRFGQAIPQPQRNDPTVQVRNDRDWNPPHLVQNSLPFPQDPTGLSPTSGWDRLSYWNHGPTAKIEYKDNNCRSALHPAAQNGHQATVRLLLDHGAKIEAMSNDTSWTALHLAAQNGHEATVSLLLDHEANIEAKDNNGMSVIQLAAQKGHEATVSLLLDHEANIEAKDNNGMSAIQLAAQKGHEATVRLLLDRGANMKAKIHNDMSALELAALNGHEATVQLLLNLGAETGDPFYDQRALHLAAECGHEATVRLLLDHGTQAEAKDDRYAQRALHLATKCGHEATVRLLLDRGAKIDDALYGRRVLHLAAEGGHEAVVRLLLERQAEIEAKVNDEGTTALHIAAMYGYEATVRLLLDRGAEIEATDRNGRTALHLAAEGRHESVTRLLRNRGAVGKVTSFL